MGTHSFKLTRMDAPNIFFPFLALHVKGTTLSLDLPAECGLNIVGTGEIIGEMAALEEVPRSTDAITLTPTKVCSIPA